MPRYILEMRRVLLDLFYPSLCFTPLPLLLLSFPDLFCSVLLASMEKSLQNQLSTALCASQQRYEWVSSDVPSDITIEVDGVPFHMHTIPIASRCGRIQKLLAETRNGNSPCFIHLRGVPGGVESFVIAARFCYGAHIEITAANVALLSCVSDYLEMTEDYFEGNLCSKSEEGLENVFRKSFDMSIEVLQHCVNLLPFADELNVVGRCVDAVASWICVEQIVPRFTGELQIVKKSTGYWWMAGLSSLDVSMFRRVILALKRQGLIPETIGASLMNYAQKELMKNPKFEPESASSARERLVAETLVCLLPVEKFAVPISFLFGLLSISMVLDCSSACMLELEARIGLRLDEASLDDLLIPELHCVMFDVDTVQRILTTFYHNKDGGEDMEKAMVCRLCSPRASLPSQAALLKVSKLMDEYIAEIAPEAELKLEKFIAVAEALPAHARPVHDGLYRAVDIYLKAHEGLSDPDRRKLAKLINFQLLTPEAASHAAQNERLPLQSVVQVLYYEQLRMRNSLFFSRGEETGTWIGGVGDMPSPIDDYASLRWENRELKLELARLRMRVSDLEKEHALILRKKMDKGSSSSFLSSVSKLKVFPLGYARAPAFPSRLTHGTRPRHS